MTNWLLEFHSNGAGRFFLVVQAEDYDQAATLGYEAAGLMGYGFQFSEVTAELG